MSFNPQWLVGKTIASVEMNPSLARPGSEDESINHDPCITFTDGSSIVFMAEEGDVDYGVDILYRPSKTQMRKAN